MLGVNQLDFINYANALKGNYRKGIHKMETLLENPTHAKEFAKNLGGVSVVLGTPVGKEDRNSETLRSMLLASDVANDAVYTWMGQYYEFDSWDELLGDEDRCKAMMANELLWRALSASGVAMGKTVATLAGLSCSAYADMSEVAASSAAMAAVAASSAAMTAIFRSDAALQVIAKNATAQAAISNASSTVMAKTVATLADLNPDSYADMNAIAASSAARAAIEKSQTAKDAIAASDVATAKYAVGAAGLNPADYANMSAVASSSAAMTAVAASSAAMAAVAASSAAMAAVINNSAALNAVVSSSAAMTAVSSAASALNAVLKNITARTKFAGSSYLQSNFDKMLSSVGNTTYFSKKFDKIDNGSKRAVSGGSTDATATANQSIFLCKKIGAWSNGTSVTGTVMHLQTGNTVGSASTTKGGGYDTDDYSTGGVQAKYVCIGGCTFAENNDAYCCGIFAFAK